VCKIGNLRKIYRKAVAIITIASQVLPSTIAYSSAVDIQTMPPQELLELYDRFRNGDDDAFGILYQQFSHQEYENLAKWARKKYDLREHDTEDLVASWWLNIYVKKPKINVSFEAFARKDIRWRILTLLRKRNPGKMPWKKPWVAQTNQFLGSGIGLRSKEKWTMALVDDHSKPAHIAHLIQLAVLRPAIFELLPDERQAIRLHRLEGRTLEEAAFATKTTLWHFRKLLEKATKSLQAMICKAIDEIETLADRDSLLMQWGEVRPDLHWVPNDKNEKCDCSACAAKRSQSLRDYPALSNSDIRSLLAAIGTNPDDFESEVCCFLRLSLRSYTIGSVGTLSA
jgi:RNA polymerase sigma factor (sigma-70 family)